MTITEFLLARIAEDEAIARRAKDDWYAQDEPLRYGETGYNATPDLTIDPARVLAECEAKRRIVEEHDPRVVRPIVDIYDDECQTCHGSEPGVYPCFTLRAVASVYAEHPDYREEWRV